MLSVVGMKAVTKPLVALASKAASSGSASSSSSSPILQSVMAMANRGVKDHIKTISANSVHRVATHTRSHTTSAATIPTTLKTSSAKKKTSILTRFSMRASDNKPSDIGEDACVISDDNSMAAVADGVGGWASEGIDAGIYARELMDHVKEGMEEVTMAAKSSTSTVSPPKSTPKELLATAYKNMNPDARGSCTACVVAFNGSKLKYANLGDSGLIGYRRNHRDAAGDLTPFVRSQEQQHTFNCPYQLGHVGEDRPNDAHEADVTIEAGDLIVLATDGFFDNLYDHKIMTLIQTFIDRQVLNDRRPHGVDDTDADIHPTAARSPSPSPTRSPSPPPYSTSSLRILSSVELESLAAHLVNEAMIVAKNRNAQTPFAENAHRNHKRFNGGKMDDVTVVIAQVQQVQSEKLTIAPTTSVPAAATTIAMQPIQAAATI